MAVDLAQFEGSGANKTPDPGDLWLVLLDWREQDSNLRPPGPEKSNALLSTVIVNSHHRTYR